MFELYYLHILKKKKIILFTLILGYKFVTYKRDLLNVLIVLSLFTLKEADFVAYNIAQLPLYNLRERSPISSIFLILFLDKNP